MCMMLMMMLLSISPRKCNNMSDKRMEELIWERKVFIKRGRASPLAVCADSISTAGGLEVSFPSSPSPSSTSSPSSSSTEQISHHHPHCKRHYREHMATV